MKKDSTNLYLVFRIHVYVPRMTFLTSVCVANYLPTILSDYQDSHRLLSSTYTTDSMTVLYIQYIKHKQSVAVVEKHPIATCLHCTNFLQTFREKCHEMFSIQSFDCSPKRREMLNKWKKWVIPAEKNETVLLL